MLADFMPSRSLLHFGPVFPLIDVSRSVTSSLEVGQNNSPCSEGTDSTSKQQESPFASKL